MKLSEEGVDFIVSFEGLHKKIGDGRYIAYQCPAGVWTIYAGCTEGVKPGMIWTEAEGRAAFRRELAKHEAAVLRLAAVDLNQNQFDALVSFSYNVGIGALSSSSLLKKLNRGDYAGAQRCFMDWNKATVNGKKTVLRGLSRRRAAEAELFARRTTDENEIKGDLEMAQAVEPPKVPISGAVKAAGATAGGAVAAKGAEAMLAAPPPVVTDTVGNVGMWVQVGKTAEGLMTGLGKSPVFAASLFVVGIAVIWGSWAYKKWTA